MDVSLSICCKRDPFSYNVILVDLSLYKDESQLDKASPRKRKRGTVKSEAGDDEESESDEEETEDEEPLKKKNNATPSRGAASKKPVQKKTMDSESTGSDNENLLEIRKRSKNQVSDLLML